jgi:hypothetical protein
MANAVASRGDHHVAPGNKLVQMPMSCPPGYSDGRGYFANTGNASRHRPGNRDATGMREARECLESDLHRPPSSPQGRVQSAQERLRLRDGRITSRVIENFSSSSLRPQQAPRVQSPKGLAGHRERHIHLARSLGHANRPLAQDQPKQPQPPAIGQHTTGPPQGGRQTRMRPRNHVPHLAKCGTTCQCAEGRRLDPNLRTARLRDRGRTFFFWAIPCRFPGVFKGTRRCR